MNVKNRLKKIEGEMNLDSNFCRCDKEFVIKVELRSETGELAPPKLCAMCGKEDDPFRRWKNFVGEIRVITPTVTREEFEEYQTHAVGERQTYEQYLAAGTEN